MCYIFEYIYFQCTTYIHINSGRIEMHSAPKVHVNKDLKGADLKKFFNIDSMQSYGKKWNVFD